MSPSLSSCIEHLIRSAPRAVGLMEIENLFRSTALAVGLMEIEHFIRSALRAVGLKPSAMQGKARLRGLWRREYPSPSVHIRYIRANPWSIPALRGKARLRGRDVARAG